MKSPFGVLAGLVASDLVHAYGEGAARTAVLDRVSVRFHPGELALVMGASGSGKSTLLAVLGGLLRPDAGQVHVGSVSLWTLAARPLENLRHHHCAYIFQGFNLFSALTALEQVSLPLRFGGTPRAEAQARAEQALDEVGLSGRLQLRPGELSGGEKQRVGIARALVTRPAVLFADEPTSALDSANSERVIALLQDIARRHGTTVVAVTHDPRLKRHADRILHLGDGAIRLDERAGGASA